MKKVLIYSLAYYPDNVSGAEVAIKETTDRISPEEIEFHLVTLRFGSHAPQEERIGNVFVHRVGVGGAYLSKVLFVLLAALKARSLSRENSFDAVWAMMTYMLFPAMLARALGLRAPLVLTLQDGDSYEKVFERWFIRPFTPILDWGFRSAVIVQVISKYLATWPAKRGYRGVVEVIPNGASLQSSAVIPEEEIVALKRELGKKEGEVFLVSVSRLVHQKAIDIVVRALALLPAHVRYIVVGDGEDRAMLESLVKELGLGARVTFVGQVDRTMTAKYRKASDIFVLPSRSEGQGISFASTMVAGLPIVATQEGGIADFLFDAKRNPDKPTTGWAVDVDNPEQIAEAVQDILAHPEKVEEVVANAKKFAMENFDWNAIAKKMEATIFAKAFASNMMLIRVSVANLVWTVSDGRESVRIGYLNKEELAKGIKQLDALGGAAILNNKGKEFLEKRFDAIDFEVDESTGLYDARFRVDEKYLEPIFSLFADLSLMEQYEYDRTFDFMREIEEAGILTVEELKEVVPSFKQLQIEAPAAEGSKASSRGQGIQTRRLYRIFSLSMNSELLKKFTSSPLIRTLTSTELSTTNGGSTWGTSSEGIEIKRNLFQGS